MYFSVGYIYIYIYIHTYNIFFLISFLYYCIMSFFVFLPTIPLLDIYPKDCKLFCYKGTCSCMFTIAKIWNQPKCSSSIEWMKKMSHMYTTEYYAAMQKDEFISFTRTWMNMETIILSKLTQEQETKHHMFSLLSGYWAMRTHDTGRGTSHTGVCCGWRDRGGIILGEYLM